ncbi:unnamed protein product [Gordionus sp. m RMFG-2023]
MRQNYMKTGKFKADIIALLPTDLLYLKLGIWPIFRINRIFKYPVLPQLFDLLEIILRSSYILRMFRIVLYLLLLINVKASCFYLMSKYEGFGINDWVYDNKGHAYLRCFYFGLKTSTGIGNNEGANNNLERIYMTIIWLIGTFSVALFIAQVRAIFEDSRRNITEFRNALDKTMNFLKNSNIPPYLTNKVRLWIIYTWKSQKCLDENEFLDFLSLKMQTDIAISVHYETLSKVQLFQDCERNLLRDLVLKLKPVVYLPGDYICKKGEIGKEMYIINSGIVEVTIGKDPNLIVLATLKEGSVFGEISLLSITGENRRTANVRSKGFSKLFVLSKENLEDTLMEYPDAKTLLEKKARKILKSQKKKTGTKKNKESTELPNVTEDDVKVKALSEPKMIDTVLKIMDPTSKTVQMLKKGEHFTVENNPDFENQDLSNVIRGSSTPKFMRMYRKINNFDKKNTNYDDIRKGYSDNAYRKMGDDKANKNAFRGHLRSQSLSPFTIKPNNIKPSRSFQDKHHKKWYKYNLKRKYWSVSPIYPQIIISCDDKDTFYESSPSSRTIYKNKKAGRYNKVGDHSLSVSLHSLTNLNTESGSSSYVSLPQSKSCSNLSFPNI